MKEVELFYPIKKILESWGYKVYSEVLFKQSNRYIDVVALDEINKKSLSVELKLVFNKKLEEQALFNKNYFDKSYICIPYNQVKKIKNKQIGVFTIKGEDVYLTQEPSANPFNKGFDYLKERLVLHSINSIVGAGVQITHDSLTSKQMVIAQIKNILITQKKIETLLLFNNITHHYSSFESFLSFLQKHEEFQVVKEEGKLLVLLE